jgi:hypothetical protein
MPSQQSPPAADLTFTSGGWWRQRCNKSAAHFRLTDVSRVHSKRQEQRIPAEVIASDAAWLMVFNGAIDHIIQINPKCVLCERRTQNRLFKLLGFSSCPWLRF